MPASAAARSGGLPPFLPKDAEELGEYCFALRDHTTAIFKKFKGEQWARIEKGLKTAEEERRELRADFEETVDKIDMDARMKAAQADEDCEKATKPWVAEVNRLKAQLGRETSDDAKKAIERQLRELEAKITTETRARDKARRHFLEVWKNEQEEKAYKELRAAIQKIDDRVAEYNKQKRQLR